MSKTTAARYRRWWLDLADMEERGLDIELIRPIRRALKRMEREEAVEVLLLVPGELPEHVKGFIFFEDGSVRVMSHNQGTWIFQDEATFNEYYGELVAAIRADMDRKEEDER